MIETEEPFATFAAPRATLSTYKVHEMVVFIELVAEILKLGMLVLVKVLFSGEFSVISLIVAEAILAKNNDMIEIMTTTAIFWLDLIQFILFIFFLFIFTYRGSGKGT